MNRAVVNKAAEAIGHGDDAELLQQLCARCRADRRSHGPNRCISAVLTGIARKLGLLVVLAIKRQRDQLDAGRWRGAQRLLHLKILGAKRLADGGAAGVDEVDQIDLLRAVEQAQLLPVRAADQQGRRGLQPRFAGLLAAAFLERPMIETIGEPGDQAQQRQNQHHAGCDGCAQTGRARLHSCGGNSLSPL